MRVLFIAPNIPFPPTDGGRMVVYHTLRSIAESGCEVAIAGLVTPDDAVPREFTDRFRVWSYETDQRARPLGVLRSLFYSKPYSYAKCQPAGFAEQALRAADTFRPDLIHVDTLHVGTFGLSLARRYRIPAILRLLNVDSVLMSRFRDSQRNPLTRAYAQLQTTRTRNYERRYVPEFDRCVAITRLDAEALSRIAGVEVQAIHAGVDTEYYTPSQEHEEPWSLVSAALMRWLPNVISVRWFLDRVFPLVKRDIPAAKFYVIGKDPPADIRGRHDRNSVVVTGFVKDIRSWVARGSVFIVPTIVGSGMRIKILEALAMGKAIVSTRLGCEGIEGLVSGVNIMLADTPADFAGAIAELLADADMRHGLGEAGRELVLSRFQWRDVAREFCRLYERTVSRDARTRSEKECSRSV